MLNMLKMVYVRNQNARIVLAMKIAPTRPWVIIFVVLICTPLGVDRM